MYYKRQDGVSGEGHVDLNVLAFRIMRAATEGSTLPDKKKAASRKGGMIGGPSRALKLTKERRREIAVAANAVRWGDEVRSSK